jgi:hypothetical protein
LGFSPNDPYWLFRAFFKTPNISHATTTGLESAFKKQLNSTVLEPIEKLRNVLPKTLMKMEGEK